jgi:sugar phosphate isomerase/epimerase
MLFQTGLNPYGIAYTVGLQGFATSRANPEPIGLDGFIETVQRLELPCIEVDWRWLTPLDDRGLAAVRQKLQGRRVIYSHWLAQEPGESLAGAVRCAQGVGAELLRLHLTPVLEGARAHWGGRWNDMVAHARRTLRNEAPRVAEAGLALAIENHQDFGSEELVALAEELGEDVGIVLDTGNPYAVGEDPVAFACRASHRIRHVHFKDYVAQFTTDGYRLVRCAIGDGAVPFAAIADVLGAGGRTLTASIEPGALEARHIRLFTPGWWTGYPPRQASELGTLLGRLRQHCLDEEADYRTPWETGTAGQPLVDFEWQQLDRSVRYLRSMGWLQTGPGSVHETAT